jgi:F-type H+-transporting ATPase subunit alpha
MQENLNNKKNKEIGHIASFFSGVARIQGLPHIFLHEVLLDEAGEPAAIVIGFDESFVEALFFDEKFNLEKPIFRSFKPFSISISDKYIGRIIDGLGRPRDGLGSIQGKATPVFKQAPPIIDRFNATLYGNKNY